MPILLNDEEIEEIWENVEKQRFEHPDADKPDFQFFDPVVYGKAVREAQLKKVIEWGEEDCTEHRKAVKNYKEHYYLPRRDCPLCQEALKEAAGLNDSEEAGL